MTNNSQERYPAHGSYNLHKTIKKNENNEMYIHLSQVPVNKLISEYEALLLAQRQDRELIKELVGALKKSEPAESGWLAENFYQEVSEDDDMHNLLEEKWATNEASRQARITVIQKANQRLKEQE